ncbi:MAG TPA: hypothetical protein VME46_07435 [Acidimicrobiales bacterium]|nr:hypothetical protein [Acidimicrobiales bacterium]
MRSLTAWERVVVAGLVRRWEWAAANVGVSKAKVARSGFVSVLHLAIAGELQPVVGAVGFAGIAASSVGWATGATVWPLAVQRLATGWHGTRPRWPQPPLLLPKPR